LAHVLIVPVLVAAEYILQSAVAHEHRPDEHTISVSEG